MFDFSFRPYICFLHWLSRFIARVLTISTCTRGWKAACISARVPVYRGAETENRRIHSHSHSYLEGISVWSNLYTSALWEENPHTQSPQRKVLVGWPADRSFTVGNCGFGKQNFTVWIVSTSTPDTVWMCVRASGSSQLFPAILYFFQLTKCSLCIMKLWIQCEVNPAWQSEGFYFLIWYSISPSHT